MSATVKGDSNSFESCVMVSENQRESYIYICGIQPIREISIDDHVTLMPVQPSANPDDMIDCFMKNGNGSEFELGMLISTFRTVTAQLRITADNPQKPKIQKTENNQQILDAMIARGWLYDYRESPYDNNFYMVRRKEPNKKRNSE